MSYCACGNPIPDGFEVCELCCEFGDDDPLPSDEPPGYTPTDARLDAMSDETYWFGMTCWDGDEGQQEKAA